MPEPTILINLNGKIIPPERVATDAKVSVFDRSYLYGDSLYEVVRTYNGKFFGLDEHLDRLEKSAALCHMKLGQSKAQYKDEILKALTEWQKRRLAADVYCRLIVSRGEGKIGFGVNCLRTPTLFTIILQPLEPPGPEVFARGFHFQISERLRNDPRALDPAMKSGNYLNSLLAYLEAVEAGCDDALLCNQEGHLTEGTTFNIFYARGGIIATPPLEIGILDGITRRKTIDHARKLGYPVREVRFPKERLYEADEVFMTSSIKEVFPVTKLDGKAIAHGKIGKITRHLHEEFHAQARPN